MSAIPTTFIDVSQFGIGQRQAQADNLAWQKGIQDLTAQDQNQQWLQYQRGLALPLAEAGVALKLGAIGDQSLMADVNRRIAGFEGDIIQRSASVPQEQRSQFIANNVLERLRTLAKTPEGQTPEGQLEAREIQRWVSVLAANAWKQDDRAAAATLLQASQQPSSIAAGRQQAIDARTNLYGTQLPAALSGTAPYYVDTYTGDIFDLNQRRATNAQNQNILAGLQPQATGAGDAFMPGALSPPQFNTAGLPFQQQQAQPYSNEGRAYPTPIGAAPQTWQQPAGTNPYNMLNVLPDLLRQIGQGASAIVPPVAQQGISNQWTNQGAVSPLFQMLTMLAAGQQQPNTWMTQR